MNLPIAEVTCAACGCLCDDLHAAADGAIEAHGCLIGQWWFTQHGKHAPAYEAMIGQRPVTRTEALGHAADLLAKSRWPLIVGGASLDVAGQRALFALADHLGAAIDLPDSPEDPTVFFPGAGSMGCTWGEVIHRADRLLYWQVDRTSDWHRHGERVLERSRSRPGVTIIDTSTERLVPVDREMESIWTLRALMQGRPVEAAPELVALAERLKSAKYAVIIHHARPRIEVALQMLARDVNERTRCRLIDLGSAENSAGFHHVSLWQTGYRRAVSFHRGYPTSMGREFAADSLLARGDVDVVVSVGRASEQLSESARTRMQSIPQIHLSTDFSSTAQNPHISLFSQSPLASGTGVVFRADGVSLPLRGPISSSFPSPEMVIKGLMEELGKRERESRPTQGTEALCSPT